MSSEDFRGKSRHIPFAREGVPYVAASAFVTLITAIIGPWLLAWLFLFVTLLVGHFFRDPQRVIPTGESDVVAPADGRIVSIENVRGNRFINGPCVKISIFLSVFDVHVNRIPYSGVVQGIQYQKGKYRAANLPRAGSENEQSWLWIRTDSEVDLVVVQVAGLIARRIVCWPTLGDRVVRGERYGMIRFGSRTDLYVPADSDLAVSKGDRVVGGETVLCRLK
ncbi:MAG: phosphatidylserine decarboxylase family protein [Desulforhabdus sp.]|nr:phosphatidylserine decarboxylase family protein [Desulforhabdus sp.]